MMSQLTFSPFIPWSLLGFFIVLGLVLVGLALWQRARGVTLRIIGLAILISILLNPRIIQETRTPQPDIAIVIIDESPSQAIEGRRAQNELALKTLRDAIGAQKNFELKIVRVKAGGDGKDGGGTHLFGPLAQAAADVPVNQLAGVVMITDGQVHDIPELLTQKGKKISLPGPIHVVLTGKRNESDRRLIIEKAPSYGLVGKDVSIGYRVEDRRAQGKKQTSDVGRAEILFKADGKFVGRSQAVVGKSQTFTFKLEHAGATVVELEVEEVKGELTTLNNQTAVSINGVRERLRVVLISGQPHVGERTWRNLLKSDPAVDLVHFTILRPPEKNDFTPLSELSLIAFPVGELFDQKLNEFDLLVFDRYLIRDVIPVFYLDKISEYLKKGGAVLFSVGPEFSGNRSVYKTPLGKIIPAAPTGKILEQGFIPTLTELGTRHPVTSDLTPNTKDSPKWGRWFRQVEATVKNGKVLMNGAKDLPLLVLNREGKGRIALLLSDHIWLWGRGHEGGGPQAELLRRLAHWLMKEPELEEERLNARVEKGQVVIERSSLSPKVSEVIVTTPSGAKKTLTLKQGKRGIAKATIPASEPGLYRIDDGEKTALAAAWVLNPKEMADLRATEDSLAPISRATGGGLVWLSEGVPEFRRTRIGRDSAGQGWLGFRQNEAYVVTGVNEVSLLPGILIFLFAVTALGAAWWREGR
jgi:hypothetical protein